MAEGQTLGQAFRRCEKRQAERGRERRVAALRKVVFGDGRTLQFRREEYTPALRREVARLNELDVALHEFAMAGFERRFRELEREGKLQELPPQEGRRRARAG